MMRRPLQSCFNFTYRLFFALKYFFSSFFFNRFSIGFRVVLLAFCFLSSGILLAQDEEKKGPRRNSSIIDDSTKQVYGPKTSRYILEKDLLVNKTVSYPADTSLDNFHEYNFISQAKYRYVDLGNIGTAMRPLFVLPPSTIGTRLGIDAFDAYALSPDSIKYYDTKSPYTRLYYANGGKGMQVFQVEANRNINARWSIGVDAKNFSSQKQYGDLTQNNSGTFASRAVVSWAAAFKTRYFNKDSTYQILGHFSHLNHFLKEQGGVNLTLADNSLDDFFVKATLEKLQYANARDTRNNWHIYQEYVPFTGLQVFHIFDREKRSNNFSEYNHTTDSLFYTQVPNGQYFSSDTSSHETNYQLFDNRLGLKGKFNKFDYRLYARNRTYTMSYVHAPYKQRGSENFLGLVLDYQFSNRANLHAEGEYMLFKDYRLEGTYENRFLKLKYQRYVYSPTLIQQLTYNPPFAWKNDFSPSFYDNIYASLKYQDKFLFVSPYVQITNLKNYIYYDRVATPQQSSTSTQIFQAGLKMKYMFSKFITENEVVFTGITGADVVRIPSVFATARFYFQNILFNGATEVQVGIQANYKSTYYANAYMPVTTQFYLQDDFKISGYPVVDIFANARIKAVRIFLKFAHANQGFPAKGYFPTPFYPGIQRTLGFGATWQFFD